MAMSHALHSLGQRREATELVSALLGPGSSGDGATADGWLLYKVGALDLTRQTASLWRELRDAVRR
jgi:hypothetical protein